VVHPSRNSTQTVYMVFWTRLGWCYRQLHLHRHLEHQSNGTRTCEMAVHLLYPRGHDNGMVVRDLVLPPEFACLCTLPDAADACPCGAARRGQPDRIQEQEVQTRAGHCCHQGHQDLDSLFVGVRSRHPQRRGQIPNNFSSIIIEDMGFSTTKTTVLKSVGDITQIVALVVGGVITPNIKNTRLIASTAANIICVVAAACMAYLPRHLVWQRLVSFWLVNCQSVGFVVSLVMVPSNMGGYTHRVRSFFQSYS